MTEIMLSVRPKWCELIVSGKKRVEVRRTKPKCDTPFRAYIYCTEGDVVLYSDGKQYVTDWHKILNRGAVKGFEKASGFKMLNGKVIGEFVCDRIDEVDVIDSDLLTYITVNGKSNMGISRAACLNVDDFHKYLGNKTGYSWHISNLKIYDKPKELSEFWKANVVCPRGIQKNDCDGCWDCEITRPPQSWYYVKNERCE